MRGVVAGGDARDPVVGVIGRVGDEVFVERAAVHRAAGQRGEEREHLGFGAEIGIRGFASDRVR